MKIIPKLIISIIKDFIPNQFLPSYNSVVIERYLHKIPDLAEHFVYFNDDFYIINHIDKSRFFQNGLPCDISIFQYNPNWSQWYIRIKNNIKLINKHFNKKEVINNFYHKWFSPLYGKKIVDELLDEILSKIYYITNTSQCTTFF